MWECCALVAVALEIKNGICRKAAVSLGAAVAHARRFGEAEKLLEGRSIDEKLARDAARIAADSITQFTAIQGSPEYKREITPALIKRCILKAFGG